IDSVVVVGPERLKKLKNVIHKIFSKFGKITNEFYAEVAGTTKGYVFLEYVSPNQALEAVKNADGYKLDKQHTFRLNLFTDFDKYMNISNPWETPEKQQFKDFGNMRHWLEDPDCRDQYSVIYESGERTAIFSSDPKEPILVEERAVSTFPLKQTCFRVILSMGLLDKKSLKISYFSWSPGDNIIAFWVPEDKDIPAKVTLMQFPSRLEIRVHNLFNVVDCKLHWQRQGDYLCVKVDRTPRGTQGVITNFEIFCQFMVLAGLRSMNGAFAFVDTLDCTIMYIVEHYMASGVEWDPTGRYVVTSVSWWSHKVDNAYWPWMFQGRLLQKNIKDRFCQLLWRPCPPTLLSQEQIKAIKKDLKKYSEIFEQKDRLSQSKASKELVDKRLLMMEEYRRYKDSAIQLYNQQREMHLQLRGGVDTDELDSNVEDWEEENIEFFISDGIINLGDLKSKYTESTVVPFQSVTFNVTLVTDELRISPERPINFECN
uniref:Eukaryotic translation initiation factor 3, subunit Bb n=1 Tax=Cyprinus carpio TaxID=7962 RepID=A0A8C1KIW1_CYPCA